VNSILLTIDKMPVEESRLRGELAVYYVPVGKYRVKLNVHVALAESM